MQIKFKNLLVDKLDLEYFNEYQESLRGRIKEGVNTCNFKEVYVDNTNVGFLVTADYNHSGSKSRMLQIVDLHLTPEAPKEKILEEIIRKNKKDYFSIYMWVDSTNEEELDFYSKVGVFIVTDPTMPYRFTNNYKRDDIINLNNRVACLFYEDEERYKGTELINRV